MPTIRRADATDLEDVLRLRMDFFREVRPDVGEIQPVMESNRRYLAEKLPSGEFRVWFAEEQGLIVGTGGLVFFHRPPTPNCLSDLHAYVLNMYTLPEWRGRGVATMLLRHIIEHVRTTHAGRISLHATEMGRPIYERLGFAPCDSEMVLSL